MEHRVPSVYQAGLARRLKQGGHDEKLYGEDQTIAGTQQQKIRENSSASLIEVGQTDPHQRSPSTAGVEESEAGFDSEAVRIGWMPSIRSLPNLNLPITTSFTKRLLTPRVWPSPKNTG